MRYSCGLQIDRRHVAQSFATKTPVRDYRKRYLHAKCVFEYRITDLIDGIFFEKRPMYSFGI